MDQNENVLQDEIPEIPADWAYPKPIQPTITFNDGSVINGYAILSGITGELQAFPEDKSSIVEMFSIFSNPGKTSRIESETSSTGKVTYEGYTNMTAIDTLSDGKFLIRLTKPLT